MVNNTEVKRTCNLSIHDIQGRVSIWNCENGVISEIPSIKHNTDTHVTVSFDPYEAFWLVVDPNEKALPADEIMENQWVIVDTLNYPWRVRIDSTVQPPVTIPYWDISTEMISKIGTRKPLETWLNWGLNKFTGYIDYTTTFEFNSDTESFLLDLGEVKYMAEVWINGQAIGQRLWPPFKYDLGKSIHSGENQIKIRVGNLSQMQWDREVILAFLDRSLFYASFNFIGICLIF